jgi:hypothetical protein
VKASEDCLARVSGVASSRSIEVCHAALDEMIVFCIGV